MEFSITFDYLCPFARNANEAVIEGVRRGRDWRPAFRAFSLSQVHLEEGAEPVWTRDDEDLPSGVPALLWGLAVRDEFPERFADAHLALFAARHDRGLDIGDETVLREAVAAAGLDGDEVARVVAGGASRRALAEDHTGAEADHEVFGVPTLVAGREAAFVRMMERGDADDLGRILEMLSWTGLNEFKRTRIPR
jgi:hypothetical protein